ncbi:NUDIX domain-containing protein [Solibacillus sp. MA9]|uniref:NUDIX domain-containing protein n=1 Tax=Solibacillus palustris TaxID=2908203 RepID=A0ABS9UHY1_9BACL|nr:NUDIX domain-containing protein [Solibacillus sp. MA9]MCH7323907.1 NUDIX domain-containing protein [Solibacillus sp. MA9]
MTISVFGEKKANERYVKRDAVYSVVFDKKKERIAIVIVNSEHCFLPGGGIEYGEDHVRCLQREAREEIGMNVEVLHYLGCAQQYFYSVNDAKHYLNEGHFYLCEKDKDISGPLEEDHSLIWLDPMQAMTKLVHGH